MKELATEYKAAGYFRHGPPSKEAASAQRDARRAALSSSGLPVWAESSEGRNDVVTVQPRATARPSAVSKAWAAATTVQWPSGVDAGWAVQMRAVATSLSAAVSCARSPASAAPSRSSTATVVSTRSRWMEAGCDWSSLRTASRTALSRPQRTRHSSAPAVSRLLLPQRRPPLWLRKARSPQVRTKATLAFCVVNFSATDDVRRPRSKRADDGRAPAGTVQVAEGAPRLLLALAR